MLETTKRVADPVHGPIRLTPLETAVIDTGAFQRLRGVKHLGLANLVFPGADYSRFAHCIGVCHVTGRILEAVSADDPDLDPEQLQLYRLAGLLHDIGHYPYSHSFEQALKEWSNRSKVLVTADEKVEDEGRPVPPLVHEQVSAKVLEHDDELRAVLDGAGFEHQQIARIFQHQEQLRYTNLISSDLDADRIDYLLRTAHHTRLPYGSVDLDYLLSQVRLDAQKRLCFDRKALRTIEHLLLGRFFDYQQVAFHKTVAGLEWLLEEALIALFERGALRCGRDDVIAMVQSGDWRTFDDAKILERIRGLVVDEDALVARKASALLRREPPKLLWEYSAFKSHGVETEQKKLEQYVREQVAGWAEELSIPAECWHVWESRRSLTKIGTTVPLAVAADEDSDSYYRLQEAVRILGPGDNSEPLVSVPASLMNVLSSASLCTIRVYLLAPLGEEGIVQEAISRVNASMSHLPMP